MVASILRFLEDTKLKVVILGPDGAGKSSVIQGLFGILSNRGCAVKVRHLKPCLVMSRRGEAVTIVTDPHGKPPRSALTSMAKILIWLAEEWYAHLFQDGKEILLCDRYYHDIQIDSKRYRYGGPAWAARSVGKLMPQPDLWVLLDAPADVLQARKQEVPPEETSRQRGAYNVFVRNQANYVVVNAAQPVEKVIRDVEESIAQLLERV